MVEFWAHETGRHRYWCPRHVTPVEGGVLVYVQRDTLGASRACAYAASQLVRFDLSTQSIPVGGAEQMVSNGWPPEWSAAARRTLEASLGEVFRRRRAA